MYRKLVRALKGLHRGQRGITGLETAIILIAFVTAASIVAYSVLSAGVFSAERSKEVVYRGIEQAQGTVGIKSSILGLSDNGTGLDQVQFNLGLVVRDVRVDTSSLIVNYFDNDIHIEGVTVTIGLSVGSTERGATAILEYDELHTVVVTIPAAASLGPCDSFTIQIIPPTGGIITINRLLPGSLTAVMDLH